MCTTSKVKVCTGENLIRMVCVLVTARMSAKTGRVVRDSGSRGKCTGKESASTRTAVITKAHTNVGNAMVTGPLHSHTARSTQASGSRESATDRALSPKWREKLSQVFGYRIKGTE